MSSTAPLTYDQAGVNYDLIDPLKVTAQRAAAATAAHLAAWATGGRTYYTAPIKALVSEKFFALADTFGADQVGMVTGDASVNADAPIICCTAEILAGIALREGPAAEVAQVVMDEFHFVAHFVPYTLHFYKNHIYLFLLCSHLYL